MGKHIVLAGLSHNNARLLLVGLNALPLAGALLFSWDLSQVLTAYWLAIAIAGFYNILYFFYQTAFFNVHTAIFSLFFNSLTYVLSVFLIGIFYFSPALSESGLYPGSFQPSGETTALWLAALAYAVGYGIFFLLIIWREEPDKLTIFQQVVLSTFIIWLHGFIVGLGGLVASFSDYFYRGWLAVFSVKTASELYMYREKLFIPIAGRLQRLVSRSRARLAGISRPPASGQTGFFVIIKYAGLELFVIFTFIIIIKAFGFFELRLPAAVADVLIFLAIISIFALPFLWGFWILKKRSSRNGEKAPAIAALWQWPDLQGVFTAAFCLIILLVPAYVIIKIYRLDNWQKITMYGTRYKIERNLVYYSPSRFGFDYWEAVPGADAVSFRVYHGLAAACPDARDNNNVFCQGEMLLP